MTVSKSNRLKFLPLSQKNVLQARKIIFAGLKEHFGFIDTSLNSDLKNPLIFYSQPDTLFLVGYYHNQPICTGAIIPKTRELAQIVRVSVKKEYRKCGFGAEVVHELENRAKILGYYQIILETTRTWKGVIEFYLKLNYRIQKTTQEDIYFFKVLTDA